MKRLFDVLISSLLLVVLSPLFLFLGMLVYYYMRSSVLFSQIRPGKDEKLFRMYKFRSMNNKTDNAGRLLGDELRLTRFGEILRSTSLDELPALWNVLVGDMSLVGPRPLLVEYLPLYSAEQSRRHEVRPGITGWAQVNGRNAISWAEKFRLDVWYVDNRNIWLDFKILLFTLKKVIVREGISSEASATMEKFKGR